MINQNNGLSLRMRLKLKFQVPVDVVFKFRKLIRAKGISDILEALLCSYVIVRLLQTLLLELGLELFRELLVRSKHVVLLVFKWLCALLYAIVHYVFTTLVLYREARVHLALSVLSLHQKVNQQK